MQLWSVHILSPTRVPIGWHLQAMKTCKHFKIKPNKHSKKKQISSYVCMRPDDRTVSSCHDRSSSCIFRNECLRCCASNCIHRLSKSICHRLVEIMERRINKYARPFLFSLASKSFSSNVQLMAWPLHSHSSHSFAWPYSAGCHGLLLYMGRHFWQLLPVV